MGGPWCLVLDSCKQKLLRGVDRSGPCLGGPRREEGSPGWGGLLRRRGRAVWRRAQVKGAGKEAVSGAESGREKPTGSTSWSEGGGVGDSERHGEEEALRKEVACCVAGFSEPLEGRKVETRASTRTGCEVGGPHGQPRPARAVPRAVPRAWGHFEDPRWPTTCKSPVC